MACDVTGYSQKELTGQNVKVLIPRPFSDQHDQYVMKHVTTGKATLLDKETEFVVLHKDRYVMGVSLCVTKLSGFGMDSVFMGVSAQMMIISCAPLDPLIHLCRRFPSCPRLPTPPAPG